ncbi:MAG: adenylate/guanylate cyclase domain-containing protein [Actinomycetota bacterium]|nr:adenylate/guanylate cyclase domain-containing protein [Actinomycetota bacterium]
MGVTAAGHCPVPFTSAREGTELVQRTRRSLNRLGIVANGLGAFDTFFFLLLLIPPAFEGTDPTDAIVVNAIVFAIYLPATFVLGTRWGYQKSESLIDWVGKRDPTPAERDKALHIAKAHAVQAFRFWFIGAVLFGGLNLIGGTIDEQDGLVGAIVFLTLLVGGITTAGVQYLQAERILRPVTTLALSAAPPVAPSGPGVGLRIRMVWLLATGTPLVGIIAVAVSGMFADVNVELVALGVLFLAMIAGFSGLLATKLTARSVSESLGSVRDALVRVEEGDYEVQIPIDDTSEIGLVQVGINRMAAGLAERERLHDLFGRHVGRDVARAAVDGGVKLGGEVREVGVLLVDLVGSTTMASRLPPERVVALLNRFFGLVVEVVESYGGMVNKFEGDGALCVFGAPVAREDPAGSALCAARELRARMSDELPEIDAGIGVSAGEAVAGNVGAVERFEYTVIGDPVNEAARLSELAKRRRERMVASGSAVERAAEDEARRWELGEEVVLRGRDVPTRLATLAMAADVPA